MIFFRNRRNRIVGFDDTHFRKIHRDLEILDEREFRRYMKRKGWREIRDGSRRFHASFKPFDEAEYLELFHDVKREVQEKRFRSGYEHFRLHGYREILAGRRAWPRDDSLPHRLKRMIVEESGLFDLHYYVSEYPDIAVSGMEPIDHYLIWGWREGRKPNPHCDPNEYMYRYPELERLGIPPLIHMVMTKRPEEYSSVKTPVLKPLEFHPLPLTRNRVDADNRPSIAVIVHAFYIDTLEDIVSSIENISPYPDLFVSVASDADTSEVKRFLKERGFDSKVVVKAVENRGRDVSPFLIEFADEILSYDLCCKIHGKKSLYAGGERTDWRRHLYHNLLGSEEIVEDIVSAFAHNGKLGLLFSDNYGMLPYWGYSWLTNRGVVGRLMEKIGLEDISYLLGRTYIDYPAGTMFWFRPDAIRQILETNWKYSDFPKEPIPNDGTPAHALERLFAATVRMNGYDFIELNHKLGRYSLNVCHKNFNQLEAKTLAKAKEIVDGKKSIVFDIFDTLISRPIFDPDNHFRFLEKRIDEKFDIVSDFFNIRKEVEAELRRSSSGGDVSYEDIYERMSRDEIYPEVVISFVREEDFRAELDMLRPREDVVELLEYSISKGKDILFVSDMYLERDKIEKILRNCGIECDGIDMYISSDTGLRKDSTEVWRELVDSGRLVPKKSLVIGDSEVSDAKIPGDFAIESFHLLSGRNAFYESPFGKAFFNAISNPSHGDKTLLGPVVSHLFSSPFEMKNLISTFEPKLDPYGFGYCALGPMFYLFCDHLYTRHRKDSIYFMARDGYFLREIYEKFVHSKGMEIEGKSRYLEISRRAVLGAVEKTPENLKHIVKELGEYKGRLSGMLSSRVGLGDEFMRKGSIDDITISLPGDGDRVCEILLEHIDVLNEEAHEERKPFLEYLNDLGFLSEERAVLVDLGYSGTIQRYLHDLTGVSMYGEYFVTTLKSADFEHSDSLMNGYFGNRVDPFGNIRNIVFEYSLVLEAYLTSNRGQLMKFEKRGKEIVPIYKVEENRLGVREDITRGIIDYIESLSVVPVDFFDHDSDKAKDIAMFIFEYITRHRLFDEDVLSILSIDDDFTGNEELDIVSILRSRGL